MAAHAFGLRRPWPHVAETAHAGERPAHTLTSRPFVALAAGVVNTLLLIYLLLLLARVILEYIPIFNREWRPKGFGLVLAEVVYTVTDPPLRFFRRLIPPLRLGPIALDLGFPLTMLVVFVLLSITGAIARM